jgi:hypothetical protein
MKRLDKSARQDGWRAGGGSLKGGGALRPLTYSMPDLHDRYHRTLASRARSSAARRLAARSGSAVVRCPCGAEFEVGGRS